MSSDLHDVLRDMADDRRRAEDSGAADHEPGEVRDAGGDDEAWASPEAEELAQLDMAQVERDSVPAGAGAAASARSAAYAADQRRSLTLRVTGVALLLIVGGLLIALGVWGTMVLDGREIMLSDRPGAEGMARTMTLTGYPLGACLIAGAGYFGYRIQMLRRRGEL